MAYDWNMTRREELLRVARVAVNTFQNDIDGPFVLPSGHRDDLIQRIYGILLQVERECWHRSLDNTTDIRAAEWIKKQKEAL